MQFDVSVPEVLLHLQQCIGKWVSLPIEKMGEYRLPHYDEQTIKEIEKQITPGPHLSAAQRIGIHNQQYWFRLFTLMQEQYPALTRLFGYSDFHRSIAEPYLLKYPCNHWLLRTLGSRLPQWIDEEYHAEDRDFIYQIASIEEAYERLSYAPQKRILLALDADLFAFRSALLEQEVEGCEFPTIEWSDHKLHFALFQKRNAIYYEEIRM